MDVIALAQAGMATLWRRSAPRSPRAPRPPLEARRGAGGRARRRRPPASRRAQRLIDLALPLLGAGRVAALRPDAAGPGSGRGGARGRRRRDGGAPRRVAAHDRPHLGSGRPRAAVLDEHGAPRRPRRRGSAADRAGSSRGVERALAGRIRQRRGVLFAPARARSAAAPAARPGGNPGGRRRGAKPGAAARPPPPPATQLAPRMERPEAEARIRESAVLVGCLPPRRGHHRGRAPAREDGTFLPRDLRPNSGCALVRGHDPLDSRRLGDGRRRARLGRDPVAELMSGAGAGEPPPRARPGHGEAAPGHRGGTEPSRGTHGRSEEMREAARRRSTRACRRGADRAGTAAADAAVGREYHGRWTTTIPPNETRAYGVRSAIFVGAEASRPRKPRKAEPPALQITNW